MPIDLTPYLPKQEDVTSEQISNALARLRTQSLELFPELKTTPNSVYGNLILQPLATLIATYEIAAERVRSDMILENVANGTIYDCDFVENYLKNFGVSKDTGVPVIGVVRLTFVENKQYVIDRGAQILFGANGLFNFIAAQIGDITIDRVGSHKKQGNWFPLSKNTQGNYIAEIPVIGPPGITVTEGSAALTDIQFEELASIRAVNDFETGRMPDTLPELAQLARKISYAANFADRGGTISFLKQKLPNIVGVSPIKSGDLEMQRDKNSILGVSTGKMDVLVKGDTKFTQTSIILTLAEHELGEFRSALSLPGGVPTWIDSITDVEKDSLDSYHIYGTSQDNNKAQFVSAAFSKEEILGLQVFSESLDVQNHEFDIIYEGNGFPKVDTENSGGIYRGHLFSDKIERKVELTANGVCAINGITYGVFYAEDLISGEIIKNLYIVKNGNRGVIDFDASGAEAKRFFNGLNLFFETSPDNFNVATTQDFNNSKILIYYKAKTANVIVNYRYDPTLKIVNELLNSSEVQPVVDVLPKAFNPAFIKELNITYKRSTSATIKKEQIKDELIEYFNGLSYSNIYDDTVINDIFLFGKAKSIKNIEVIADVYHSLAEKWSKDGGDQINKFSELPAKSLLEFNDTYDQADLYSIIALRNIGYILDRDNISLNEIKV